MKASLVTTVDGDVSLSSVAELRVSWRGLALIVAAIVIGTLAACASVDKTNSVSVADYKATLARIHSNVTANLVPTLEQLRDEDLNRGVVIGHPELSQRHKAAWWAAKIGLARDCAILASDVVTGAR